MGTVRYEVINGEVIAEKRGGVRRLYVPDPLGNTVALLDNTQAKTDTFLFWPYGEVASRTGTTATQFQFLGCVGYYQAVSQLAHAHGSFLSRSSARWITETSRGALNFNAYSFRNGSPVSGFVRQPQQTNAGDRDPRCDASCDDKKCTELIRHLDDVCSNRLKYVTTPELRRCLELLCADKRLRFICVPESDKRCAKKTRKACGFAESPWSIYICDPSAFNRKKCGCLGATVGHEMAHLCFANEGAAGRAEKCMFGKGTPECPEASKPKTTMSLS